MKALDLLLKKSVLTTVVFAHQKRGASIHRIDKSFPLKPYVDKEDLKISTDVDQAIVIQNNKILFYLLTNYIRFFSCVMKTSTVWNFWSWEVSHPEPRLREGTHDLSPIFQSVSHAYQLCNKVSKEPHVLNFFCAGSTTLVQE